MATTHSNSTTQVVREAMRIVSKNVIAPKVVREGIVVREGASKPVKTAATINKKGK